MLHQCYFHPKIGNGNICWWCHIIQSICNPAACEVVHNCTQWDLGDIQPWTNTWQVAFAPQKYQSLTISSNSESKHSLQPYHWNSVALPGPVPGRNSCEHLQLAKRDGFVQALSFQYFANLQTTLTIVKVLYYNCNYSCSDY